MGVGAPVRVVSDLPVNFGSNYLEETGRPYDMAINGAGFFVIETADNQRYLTRNGNFDIDENGYLILRDVGRVLGQRGAVQVENAQFTVDDGGIIL